MSSGNKREVFNTRERVISPDHNRQQSFRDAMLAEYLRANMDTAAGSDDLDAGGVAAENTVLATPVVAEVIDGLMVSPLAGTVNVAITAGRAFFIAPDGAPDDSNYKFVNDTGIPGGLAIAANGGGSARIDIIVATWSDVVLESDNRDIFDVPSGSFSAQSVSKVRGGDLTYFVRQGTVGGGYAGAAANLVAGDLPLAVVSVPAGSTTVDTCTFWDVRPLVNDRIFAPFNMTLDFPKNRCFGRVDSNNQLVGTVEVSVGARRLGGRIRRGSPGTDGDFLLVSDAANTASGQAPTAGNFYFIYWVVPFGLPRWARYTDGPSGRVPRSPRGIPIVCNVAPNKDGKPSAAINMPVSTGLLSSTTSAQLAIAGKMNGGVFQDVLLDGHTQWANGFAGMDHAGTSLAAAAATFTLVDNTDIPANAKAIYFRIEIIENNVSAGTIYRNTNVNLAVLDPTGLAFACFVGFQANHISNPTGSGLNIPWGIDGKLPLYHSYPTETPLTRTVQMSWSTTSATAIFSATLRVLGWEF